MPRISRYPSAFTPVAIRACTFTVRPPSRTFWVSASIHTKAYGPRSSGRLRKPSTSSSSSAAIADTCDLDRPTTPREAASFSTRRVDTPSRYDVATTEASARSARRRCSRNDGKYDPVRSFGMASSIVPARVSHSRRRYPLREFTRSGLTSPYPAPHRISTSASIIRWANSRTISRSTSGLADASVCSNESPGTGTMSPAATLLSFVASETTSKDREVAASHHGDTPYSGNSVTLAPVTPYTTSVDVNGARHRNRRTVRQISTSRPPAAVSSSRRSYRLCTRRDTTPHPGHAAAGPH